MDVINTPPAAPRWQNFSREHRASRHGDARRPALPRFRFGPVGANRRLERSAVHIAAQHVRVAPERLRASPLRSREDLQPARGQVALGARRARLLGTALARRYARFDHGILSPLRGLLHSRCRRISPGAATHRALDAAGLTRALCTCLPRCLCTLRSLPTSVYSSGTGTSARKACARAHWEWRSLLARPCARRRPRQR